MLHSPSAQLVADQVSFAYGPVAVLHQVTITVAPGDRIGVVGPNGSGKSTLLALMAGRLTPDSGRIATTPDDATVGLITQQLDDRPDDTVTAFLARASGLVAVTAEFEAATTALAVDDPGATPGAADRYDQALARYLAARPDEFEGRQARALDQLGLATIDPDRPTTALSGGQRTRLNLATAALSIHDILLLDEPTNDLDGDGLERLSAIVTGRTGGQVIISHDRAFLANTINAVVELDSHSHAATRYQGGFDAWQAERSRARARHQRRYQDYVDQRSDIEERIDRTRRWAAKGTGRARHGGETDKFIRFDNLSGAQNLGAKAAKADRALERLEVVDKPFEPWVLRLRFAQAPRSADRVASLSAAVVELVPPGEAQALPTFRLGPVDLEIGWGERVLITGANGSGKTTLIRALLGEVTPTSGSHHLAANAVVGRLNQQREPFPDAPDLLAGFRDATGLTEPEARSALAKLGLGPEHITRPTSDLSPGEQTRAMLGVFAATGTNLLVLDEPTNHLDLEAIEELELALDHFDGTILLVSHDRRLVEAFADGPRPVRRITVDGGLITDDRIGANR